MNEIIKIIMDYINITSKIIINNNGFKNDYMQLNYLNEEIKDLDIINNEILIKNNKIKFIEFGIINLYKSYLIYKYKRVYYLIIIYNNKENEIELSIFSKKKDIDKYIIIEN